MPDSQALSKEIDGLFIVDLRGFNLSRENQEEIEKAIQTAVMTTLANTGYAARGAFDRMYRPETMGFVSPEPNDVGDFR
jgi:hypothetical protein